MPAEPVISVRGQATLEVEPEIAVVWVVVMARDADRRKAVDLLAGRSGRIGDMIKGYGEAIEKLESQPVSVQPVFKDGRIREKVSGYLARAGFTVTVRDFAVLGDLVAGLASADMVTVTGPNWGLRPDSPGIAPRGWPRPRTQPGGRGSTPKRSAGGSSGWSRPPTQGSWATPGAPLWPWPAPPPGVPWPGPHRSLISTPRCRR